VERLQRQGAWEAGDPNIILQPAIEEHTLPDASPSGASDVVTSTRRPLRSCVTPDPDPAAPIDPLPGVPLLAGVVAVGVQRLRLRLPGVTR
jgi:hypothetical protein